MNTHDINKIKTTLDYVKGLSTLTPYSTNPAYSGPRIILEHGMQFLAYANAPDFESGRSRHYSKRSACYLNAALLASDTPDLTYVEGYAWPNQFPFPVEHAWVMTPTKRIIDPTWGHLHDPTTYYGVPFHTDWLRAFLVASGHSGVFASGVTLRKLVSHPYSFRGAFLRKRRTIHTKGSAPTSSTSRTSSRTSTSPTSSTPAQNQETA